MTRRTNAAALRWANGGKRVGGMRVKMGWNGHLVEKRYNGPDAVQISGLALILLAVLALVFVVLATVANLTGTSSQSYSVPAQSGYTSGHVWQDENRTNELYSSALTVCAGPT